MADIIRLLPDSVANQIAAGEVVQRPASVVKELVENAVDAGSTSITVSIHEGGREMIQVIDNGCGISPSDAMKAFERHATSKITCADDLYKLTTFGFRGEALASISSVAEVELRTRRAEDEIGLKLNVNGGNADAPSAINVQCGSQFIVKNLFYNVPARRKFLKNKSIETKHIVDEFQRVALCNPQIEMLFYDNDNCRYNLPAANRRQRIVNLMGKHINANLLDLNVNTSIISIEGFIGSPHAAKKSGAGEQFLFVNNRYFRSPYFHKAIMQAYEKLIQNDVLPSYFLYMTVDPTRIDVNIHPTKTEIKFEDEHAIWQIINAAVRESLGKLGAVPMMDFDNDEPIEIPVFRGHSDDIKEPVSSLNPNFNPFEDDAPVKSASGAGKYEGSGVRSHGGYLRNMSYNSEGVPEGWEELYKESYDSFDKATAKGDTFRDFILDEEKNDREANEFISHGFGDSANQRHVNPFNEAGSTVQDDIPSAGFDTKEQEESPEEEFTSPWFSGEDNTPSEGEAYSEIESEWDETSTQSTMEIESGISSQVHFLKLSNRHVVISQGGQLTVIDLYRAHNRILYEQFLERGNTDISASQQELFPEPIAVSPEDFHLLTEVRDELLNMGFDLHAHGTDSVILKGVPADMDSIPAPRLIDSLLHDLKACGTSTESNRRQYLARAMANACGLNRNRALHPEEIEALISALLACREPAFTAGGKPTMTVITQNEIIKRLK